VRGKDSRSSKKVLTRSEVRKILTFAGETATGAGKILKKGFNRPIRVTFKGRINPVTDYDLKSEKYIVSSIARTYPHHEILAEEGTTTGRSSNYRWIIDPLDGTVNFSHGFPIYCVSIALEYEQKMIVGVVYDPERDELFSAARDNGAFLNGRRTHVSSEKRLGRALLATGFAYDIASTRRNNLGLFARMAKQAQGVRRPGSAAIDLCWLASGRIDGFWELNLYPWDTAAAALIVTEAGGTISRLDGRSYSIFDKDLLASNSRLHRSMRIALNKHKGR